MERQHQESETRNIAGAMEELGTRGGAVEEEARVTLGTEETPCSFRETTRREELADQRAGAMEEMEARHLRMWVPWEIRTAAGEEEDMLREAEFNIMAVKVHAAK